MNDMLASLRAKSIAVDAVDGWPGINQESTQQAFPSWGQVRAVGIKLFSTWVCFIWFVMMGWFRLTIIPVSGIRVKVCRWSFVVASYCVMLDKVEGDLGIGR